MNASHNRSFAISLIMLVAVITLQSCAIQNDQDRDEMPSLCLTADFSTEVAAAEDPVAQAIAAEAQGGAAASPSVATPALPSLSTRAQFPGEAAPEANQENWTQVRFGETLWGIARKHGVDIKTIMELNDLSTSVLKPGQRIRLR